MKLVEMEVENVRGIRHLSLKPDGKNVVVWGPNGSGKSAVVDAIDFLLTGRISRLAGEGTGSVTFSQYGHHIDAQAKEAVVRCVLQLRGQSDPVTISRCMAKPGILTCDQSTEALLEPITALARRGQHVLTRREILKYVTARPGERAQQIQELLDISEIEDIRKSLVKARNSLNKETQAANRYLKSAEGAVNATLGLDAFDQDSVLRGINENRNLLGGEPLLEVSVGKLKSDLTVQWVVHEEEPINVTMLERDIKNLEEVASEENQQRLAATEKRLRDLLTEVRARPDYRRAVDFAQLIELGLQLLDESDNCPLCDTAWPPGELREYLEQRAAANAEVNKYIEQIRQLSSSVITSLAATISSVEKLVDAAILMKLPDEAAAFETWLNELKDLTTGLSSPLDKYPNARFDSGRVQQALAPTELDVLLAGIGATAKERFPEATPEQTAWDTLTRLEENLKVYEHAKRDHEQVDLAFRRASLLHDAFVAARDKILVTLFESIKDRFVELYRAIHGVDEREFSAKIEPDGAGLNFDVDFYGRGEHPPHALHSEGHQDSMGLCLYLALAEHLSSGLIDLIILDDVVMSVDADHRRHLCNLLASKFPERQFLITTHDRTWANELKTEGVVSSKQLVEFFNWNVDCGPTVNCETDVWDKIQDDLDHDDVPPAAARLRRASEQYFAEVCDALQATVVFKLCGRWELGDYLPAAQWQYNCLLKRAKECANSWDNRARMSVLRETASVAAQVFQRVNAEQWATNANVHYNNWANFTRNDFVDVVDAFRDLFGLFTCTQCGAMLHISQSGMKQVAVRCHCGKVDWNLVERTKSQHEPSG